jgi:hypothetical protein
VQFCNVSNILICQNFITDGRKYTQERGKKGKKDWVITPMTH